MRTRARTMGAVAAGVAVAVTGAAPAAAPAAVRISAERVVVSAPEGSVVVSRHPFALAFRDRRGRVVLRSAAPGRARSRALPVTRDPEPLGLQRESDNAVSAPLAVETGREEIAQWNGSFFPGNLLFARRSGRVATSGVVRRVTRAGAGARLVVTSGDRARDLVVTVAPGARAGLRVLARPARARGVMAMSAAFASPSGERFHGFGGRHWGVEQSGRVLPSWVEQENVGGQTLAATAAAPAIIEEGTDFRYEDLGLPALGDLQRFIPGGPDHYLFPGGPHGAYHPQGQMVSSRGYGALLANTELARWRMRPPGTRSWQVHVSAPRLDFTIVPGDVRAAVKGTTAIGGRHRLPPAWSQGAVLWRAIQVAQPAETRASVLAKIEADIAQIDRLRAPVRAYAFEGWNLLGPDLVREVIGRLHARGIRALLYVRAFVAYDELNTQPQGDVEEVLARGLAVRDAQGRPRPFRQTGTTAYTLDVTNPATRAWWKRRLELLLSWGADGFMQDFGEHVGVGDRFFDGSTGETMHNRYPVLYHRMTARMEPDLERRFGRDLYWFTRSGFTGSARHEMSNFPGDETAEWAGGSGLRSLAPDMLNRAVGGAFGFSTDIGGYLDRFNPPAGEELWTRWHEWAALTPFFRTHNSQTSGTRMPWFFGDGAYARWERLARLHERAVPLVRRLWRQGLRDGMPPTRPMWLAFPGERAAQRLDQQWMLGPDVLVAPVVVEGATTRRLWVPPGCWRRAGAGAADPGPGGRDVRGPRWATVPAPLGEPPHWVRCGTRPF